MSNQWRKCQVCGTSGRGHLVKDYFVIELNALTNARVVAGDWVCCAHFNDHKQTPHTRFSELSFPGLRVEAATPMLSVPSKRKLPTRDAARPLSPPEPLPKRAETWNWHLILAALDRTFNEAADLKNELAEAKKKLSRQVDGFLHGFVIPPSRTQLLASTGRG